jgi:hypothetical protein
MCVLPESSAEKERQKKMTTPRRRVPLKLGDRARNKLNLRVGTVDAVEKVDDRRRYGMQYDEAPQDRHLTMSGHDGAQLPPELIERE